MSMRVLIVDPDWRFALRAAAYLESHAHHVVTEADAEEAFAQARHWTPDLVILAAEVAEKGFLNKLYGMRSRPAVLLTDYMDQFPRTWRVWQMGGDELLMKPVFRAQELQEAIVTAMENAASGSGGARRTVAIPA